MKLTKFTNKELDLITVGIINQFEHIEPIDKDYNVTYEIQDYGEHHIKVTFFWNIGCYEFDDEKVVTDNYYFIINKIDTLRKYTKEINDVLDLIVATSFDTELQDWEFNDNESW
jgi:hypothetical protein